MCLRAKIEKQAITKEKCKLFIKNSKVFEQKGDLLNFKANIDPMAVLKQVKPGWAELSWVELSQAESSWVKLSRAESSWVDLSQAELSSVELSWAESRWVKLSQAEPT